MSEPKNKIIELGYGFRSNDIYPGNDYLIEEIIDHETKELENDDIFDYCEKHYQVNTTSDILNMIQAYFNGPLDECYGFWLSHDAQFVRECYADFNEPEVLKISVKDIKLLILSDLDSDGTLFVSTTPLNELPSEIYLTSNN